MDEFDHEKMPAYRLALAFVGTANEVRSRFIPGHASLADQLDRASASIVLNIAEGAGEFARREKARFYRIARRSATECAAVLDIAGERDIDIEEGLKRRAKKQLGKLVAMLVGMSKWAEDASRPSPPP